MGASSTVYEATFLPLGAVVAVKVIDCDRLSTNAIDRVRREIQLMSLSKHTNVLRVRGTWLDGPKLYIAERFMASGSMHDIVRAASDQPGMNSCALRRCRIRAPPYTQAHCHTAPVCLPGRL